MFDMANGSVYKLFIFNKTYFLLILDIDLA